MARRIGFRDKGSNDKGSNEGHQPDGSDYGWGQFLDPGERILWQGRPDTAFSLHASNIFLGLFGMAFAGFALIWMVIAASAGGGFWAFGLIHFAAGMGIILSALFGGPFKRARTWYALSTSRAFIATNLPMLGRKLKSYPITDGSVLQTDGGNPATIHFATETRRRSGKNNRGTYQAPVGFERIYDGDDVYKLLRKIQRGAA